MNPDDFNRLLESPVAPSPTRTMPAPTRTSPSRPPERSPRPWRPKAPAPGVTPGPKAKKPWEDDDEDDLPEDDE
jgi:hypothetical protein